MDFTTIIWAVVVLGALAIVFGLILAVAAKVFEVEVVSDSSGCLLPL